MPGLTFDHRHGEFYRQRQRSRGAFLDDQAPEASCGGVLRSVERLSPGQLLRRCDECGEEWVFPDRLDYATAEGFSS